MVHYRHLHVWKAALDLAVHLEHAVRRFGKTPSPPRYHKYTPRSELRQTSQRLCRWVARANNASAEGRYAALEQLVLAVDEMKTLLTLAQEMQAFANFNAFAQATELAVALGRRGGGAGCGLMPQSIADEARVAVHYPPGLAQGDTVQRPRLGPCIKWPPCGCQPSSFIQTQSSTFENLSHEATFKHTVQRHTLSPWGLQRHPGTESRKSISRPCTSSSNNSRPLQPKARRASLPSSLKVF